MRRLGSCQNQRKQEQSRNGRTSATESHSSAKLFKQPTCYASQTPAKDVYSRSSRAPYRVRLALAVELCTSRIRRLRRDTSRRHRRPLVLKTYGHFVSSMLQSISLEFNMMLLTEVRMHYRSKRLSDIRSCSWSAKLALKTMPGP